MERLALDDVGVGYRSFSGFAAEGTWKWRSYDYLTRADAAVFALLLLAFPLRLILGFRSGKHMETEQIAVFAYIIILMLVTMLGH